MLGLSRRRRAARALALTLSVAACAALVTGPDHAASAQPAQAAQATPTATTPTATPPEDLATIRPVDTPGVDPVLDEVPVVEDAKMRSTESRLNAAAAAQQEATLRWLDAERKRGELASRAGQAGQLAASAQAAFQEATLDQAVKERRLSERKQAEAELRAVLDARQDELRDLAATLYASAPEDRYAVLGSVDDITAADQRSALRDRGSDIQTDRVTAAERPWTAARNARLTAQRQVKKAVATTKARKADADDAAEERDHADQLLREAADVVARASQEYETARRATEGILDGRRGARLEARVAGLDVPLVALHAYWRASALAPCRIPWWVIAGIGRVESGHGSAHGSSLTALGDTTVHILGVPLDGRQGVAAIGDTDGGLLDDDPTWDRAVGPMQFIPGTWGRWAADGNADQKADPHNIYDAAGAAARYLCYSRGDLLTEPAIRNALLAYNRSVPYGTKVLAEGGRYRDALDLPDLPPGREVTSVDLGN